MPFPSPQGTQAVVREGCEALARRGHDVHLLVYAHGDRPYEGPVTIHRVPDWPRERSLRSGPSLGKFALDARLAAEVRRLDRQLGPDAIHAHNYEALAASLAARPRAPIVYHAHTLFGPELPTFFTSGGAPRAMARAAGELADRLLPRRAALTVAVSPRLQEELVRLGHHEDHVVAVVPGIDLEGEAPDGSGDRRRLGLVDAEILCYCGNLDGYQGIDVLVDALARLAPSRPTLRLMVVTASNTEPLEAAAEGRAVAERLHIVPHPAGLSEVLPLIAATDVAVVPRTCPGGFPVKLLSYCAAARPVVTTEEGAAGLDLGGAAAVGPDGDPVAVADALARWLDDPAAASRAGLEARRLVETRFGWESSCEALEAALAPIIDEHGRV